MEVSKELQELTNKFLEEFLELASKTENRGKRDDLYHFNFTLAEAIGNSNYPKYEEQLNILMGMSSFDDSIAKIMFNQRIQGFIPIIENKLAYKGEQDDFRIENINKTKSTEKDFKLKFFKNEKGENTFKTVPTTKKVETITFDVKNSRSFWNGGSVVLTKEKVKFFSSPNEFKERMTVVKAEFYCNGERIMTIDNKYDFDTNKMREEGSFTHYKHTASINSFYSTILSI